jgi:hypothetical protein
VGNSESGARDNAPANKGVFSSFDFKRASFRICQRANPPHTTLDSAEQLVRNSVQTNPQK